MTTHTAIKLPAQNLEPKAFAPYGEIIRPCTSSAALIITLIANAFLEAGIDRLSAAVSSGFARGKVGKAPTSKEIKEKKTH